MIETSTEKNRQPIPDFNKVKKVEPVKSPWRDTMQLFLNNKLALIGAGIIILFIIIAILAPVITSTGFDVENVSKALKAPSGEFLLGTDYLGRSILIRLIYGARISLWVGFVSVVGSVIIGTLLGIIAGYYGRWIDIIISRIFDIMLAFPSILLAIAIVAILGPSLQNALIAIATINVPNFGRLVRSRVLSLKEEEYITSARAIGMTDSRILFHHILPNSLAPIIVQATLSIGTAILDAAALGFLGMGAQAPTPEWGRMLADSRQYLTQAPWTVLAPGMAIMLTVLGFNLLGDGLRDALDPRMKK